LSAKGLTDAISHLDCDPFQPQQVTELYIDLSTGTNVRRGRRVCLHSMFVPLLECSHVYVVNELHTVLYE
jgi:hypothetical protein